MQPDTWQSWITKPAALNCYGRFRLLIVELPESIFVPSPPERIGANILQLHGFRFEVPGERAG